MQILIKNKSKFYNSQSNKIVARLKKINNVFSHNPPPESLKCFIPSTARHKHKTDNFTVNPL